MKSVFVSYSWEDKDHNEWVKNLASKLRKDGIDAKLDQWELTPGDQLTEFMEKSIRENDYVLVICTPTYKLKSDKRKGGVGYEGDIITSEIFGKKNHRKFIPLLRKGSWIESAPSWLLGKYYIDMSNYPFKLDGYSDLEATLNNKREKAPQVSRGKNQSIVSNAVISDSNKNEIEFEDIKIIGVIADQVTMPKNDGTRGSALYKVPFRLSRIPSSSWEKAFVKCWNNPPRFTSMHRPGIATIYGSTVHLDGTTIEEVKKYHKDTLKLVVEETNKAERNYLQIQETERKRKIELEKEHKRNINSIAEEINFD